MNARRLALLSVVLALGVGLLMFRSPDSPRTTSAGPEGPRTVSPREEPDSPVGRAPARASAKVDITEPVQRALAPGPFRARKQAILGLGKDLGRVDCEALVGALRAPMSETDLDVEAAVRNTLLDQLRGQPVLAGHWHETLIELATSPGSHVVLRDYALQHMVDWYLDIRTEPAYDEARRAMVDVLWRALDDTSAAISGTALLSLSQLAAEDPTVPSERIGHAALALLSREGTPAGSRISALQVCARLRVPDALPFARLWAKSGDTLALRAGAISALGILGEPSDLELLEQIGPDAATGVLRPAVTTAIQNLTGRNKG